MADMMYGNVTASTPIGGTVGAGVAGDLGEESTNDYYGAGYGGANMNNNTQPRQRFPGLYVGNLTWWTTDRDVIDAINSVGVTDVQEVKFFENRNNGQSRGFCLVTFGSEASLPIVLEKLPEREMHGQTPLVTQYNRQNLSLLESNNKPRPPFNSTNGPTSHAAGIMGINSITGVHAAANAQVAAVAAVAGMPYTGINPVGAAGAYNQIAGGLNAVGGPRNPTFHPNMRMGMRGPRGMIRNNLPGAMNNGPMVPGGHQMNRMRFMQPQQAWNNAQSGVPYNPAPRLGAQMNMDISNRLGAIRSNDDGQNQDMMANSQGTPSYYSSHHSNSDHYRGDNRDMRDDRDIGRRVDDRLSRFDDRPSRLDDRSSRIDERSARLDERSARLDDRPLHRHSDDRDRRDDRHVTRHFDDRSDRDKSRRDDRSLRRDDDRSSSRRERGVDDTVRRERGDERSSRREDKNSSTSSSRHRDSRSHRSSETKARSRSRSRDRSSRDGKDRRERERERGGGSDRERERDRARERY